MPSICLSVASNLRCAGLTRNQTTSLVVLPVVELFFCFALARFRWGGDNTRWLLILEGLVSFALVLADFFLHQSARTGIELSLFESYDKAIGVLSFFPLFLYVSFLYLLSRKDLLPLASTRRIKLIAQYSLLSIIPPLVMFHELASLSGLAYGIENLKLFIGYSSPRARSTSTFFTSVTLALLGCLQLLVACGCGFYIFRARVKGHGGGVITGFAWVGVGLLLGTLETFMGFGAVRFSLIVGRKVVRLLARSALITGVIFGTSLEEGFALFPTVNKATFGFTKEKIPPRIVISQPMSETFTHLSPNASSFYAIRSQAHPDPLVLPSTANPFDNPTRRIFDQAHPKTPIENVPSHRGGPLEDIPVNRKVALGWTKPLKPKGFQPFSPTQAEMVDLYGARNKVSDRVTVHYPAEHSAPVLEVRLSGLLMPSPSSLMRNVHTPEASDLGHDGLTVVSAEGRTLQPAQATLQMASLRRALKSADNLNRRVQQPYTPVTPLIPPAGRDDNFATLRPPTRQYTRSIPTSMASSDSIASETLALVRDLASRFTSRSSTRHDRAFRRLEEEDHQIPSPHSSNSSTRTATSHPSPSYRLAPGTSSRIRQGSLPTVEIAPAPPSKRQRSFRKPPPIPSPNTLAFANSPLRVQTQNPQPALRRLSQSHWSPVTPSISISSGPPSDPGHNQPPVVPARQRSRWDDSSGMQRNAPLALAKLLPGGDIEARRDRRSGQSTIASVEQGQILQATIMQIPPAVYVPEQHTPSRRPTLAQLYGDPMPTAIRSNPHQTSNPFEADGSTTESTSSAHELSRGNTFKSTLKHYGLTRARSSTPQYVEGCERESVVVEHGLHLAHPDPDPFHFSEYQFPIPREEYEVPVRGGRNDGSILRLESEVLGPDDRDLLRASISSRGVPGFR